VPLIRAVAFDFGHTLVDEEKDASIPLESRPIHLMPDVTQTLPHLGSNGGLGEHTGSD